MDDYKTRVVQEHDELQARLAKLLAFFASTTYIGLPPQERLLMLRQSQHMMSYAEVLRERIALFK